ncbi:MULTISPECIES: F0F1 ATP synthase subunit epsilon [Methylomicrobium]|uniref:ATP synthase epsilon chain n=1 Tax=Methylomicrobium album BG8 TaxID=686340 RepID=H8GIS1_METAL|nr:MULTISPECIES: F0F1 ATP synthase subunit epsilon [Methylomicrobium]EIC30261.1 F0F1-type ATP synthase, epsilon subunit [Methylomicrobium album BG8]
MKTFSLALIDTAGTTRFDTVSQFIGADAEGSFGLLADHIHTVALLRYGLARFADNRGVWRFLAMPGGVLRFADNQLTITTVRYFLGDSEDAICDSLEAAMQQTDSEVYTAKAALAKIEHSLIKRLVELSGQRSVGL